MSDQAKVEKSIARKVKAAYKFKSSRGNFEDGAESHPFLSPERPTIIHHSVNELEQRLCYVVKQGERIQCYSLLLLLFSDGCW